MDLTYEQYRKYLNENFYSKFEKTCIFSYCVIPLFDRNDNLIWRSKFDGLFGIGESESKILNWHERKAFNFKERFVRVFKIGFKEGITKETITTENMQSFLIFFTTNSLLEFIKIKNIPENEICDVTFIK